MKKVVAQRMTQFGQAGHVGDYEPIPLAEMAKTLRRRRGGIVGPCRRGGTDDRVLSSVILPHAGRKPRGRA